MSLALGVCDWQPKDQTALMLGRGMFATPHLVEYREGHVFFHNDIFCSFCVVMDFHILFHDGLRAAA